MESKNEFGTMPVFLASICTILGAILFLRFGYAVGNLGLLQTWFVIILGHAVTIPTALAISEIATNQKVQGGGEYYIISRSFGFNIGGTIGIILYFSQAISTAFYIIAFAQAFEPLVEYLQAIGWLQMYDLRFITIPTTLVLVLLLLTKGASLGVKALYVVAIIIFFALLLFFWGAHPLYEAKSFSWLNLNEHVVDGEDFFVIFAICFPAFTGITAGVGLSGDLKNPGRSIPLGIITAILCGMVVYLFVSYKLYISAAPQALVANQLIMEEIALWGPIVPIGLAAATLSSAIGVIIVAPRTLKAMALDDMAPSVKLNSWLRKTRGKEPFNAAILTSFIVLVFVLIGDINVVAKIITMFFMTTYGILCSVSFLENFSANPAYRPAFKSRWYISLLGALLCLFLMFKINTLIASFALLIMLFIYYFLSISKHEGLSSIFQGVIFQISRRLHVFLQKVSNTKQENWRPSIICISENTFKRLAAFHFLRWISNRYGFATYIHYINGYLSKDKHQQAELDLYRILKAVSNLKNKVVFDTLISPSFTSAIAQTIQLPSVTGKENNTILLEFSKKDPQNLKTFLDNFQLIKVVNFDICILASAEKNFGFKRNIDIWITAQDYENANLMILIAFILNGHKEWSGTNIRLMAVFPPEQIESEKLVIRKLIKSGRLPLSSKYVRFIEKTEDMAVKDVINKESVDADLTIIGFRTDLVKRSGESVFLDYDQIGDILFVYSNEAKVIR